RVFPLANWTELDIERYLAGAGELSAEHEPELLRFVVAGDGGAKLIERLLAAAGAGTERNFSTRRRHFLVIDTPGHNPHTSDLAAVASGAELAIVVVDATLGL